MSKGFTQCVSNIRVLIWGGPILFNERSWDLCVVYLIFYAPFSISCGQGCEGRVWQHALPSAQDILLLALRMRRARA